MGVREATHKYRMHEWAALIRQQQDSGLRKGEWCERNGYSRDQFFYWQRQLREAAVSNDGALALQPSNTAESAQLRWAALKQDGNGAMRGVEPAGAGLTVTIGDCQIRVDGSTDMRLLSKVCSALMMTDHETGVRYI